MKKISFALLGMGMISVAGAADITIFFSPSCPHCHHARDFINNELIYEYDNLAVMEVDATMSENRQEFIDALQKCKYESGGVPVMVIGEKCFQGYGDGMQDDLRSAVEVDLTDAQKQSAKDNRSEMKKDKDGFVASHESRKAAVKSRN